MTNRGNIQSIIQTEKGEVLILLWGKDGSGILPRRGGTWADSWMVIFLWKVKKGTPDRSHNICECMKKWKEGEYFDKAESRVY